MIYHCTKFNASIDNILNIYIYIYIAQELPSKTRYERRIEETELKRNRIEEKLRRRSKQLLAKETSGCSRLKEEALDDTV